MKQQRKIWDRFTLKCVNRAALWRENRRPKVRNGQQKGGEIPKGHFMVCVNVTSEITLNLFFFFSPHAWSVRVCKTYNWPTKIMQHCEKRKFLFLQRMTSLLTIGHLLLLLCKTLQRPDYDHHVKWNLCHEGLWMYVVFRGFCADSATPETRRQMTENGACILISNWNQSWCNPDKELSLTQI